MIVVCVPFRGDDSWRDRSWAFVRARWMAMGLGPVIDADVPGPFNRAAARNAAARLAGDWTVAIFGDADTFMRERAPIDAAVERAMTGRVVLPHDRYLALDAGGTRRAIRGRRWDQHVKTEKSDVPLGIVVVGRRAWDELGGFDERWKGWGGEDVAFRSAAQTFGLLDRIPGTLVHLWHPRDPTKSKYISERGGPLREAYRRAAGDPIAMRKLLEDRS